MITKVIKVKNISQAIPFDGDPSKQWFVEVVNSNFPAPRIGTVINGVMNLTWEPRCLNCEVEVIFHTEKEIAAVKEKAAVRRLALGIASKLPGLIKTISISIISMIVLGVGLAIASNFIDTSSFRSWWKSFNIVGVAESTEQAVSSEYAAVLTNSHDLYGSEAFKKIERKTGVNINDKFWYAGSGIFIMRDLVTETVKGEDKPVLMDYDDADSYCGKFKGIVPSLEVQKSILRRKDLPFIKYNGYHAEWTSTNVGGDDYAINLKDAVAPPAAYYSDGGLLSSDADDIHIAFRCMIYAETFRD
ncbi:hypothetical protein KKI24_27710 [bacterium]|nr:hypothetical protein [bacterium]